MKTDIMTTSHLQSQKMTSPQVVGENDDRHHDNKSPSKSKDDFPTGCG